MIFTGTVIENRTRGQTRTLTFTVDRVFKGTAYATQTVTTARQGPACGLELNRPGPFVVFASRTGSTRDALEANSCGGTAGRARSRTTSAPARRRASRSQPDRRAAVASRRRRPGWALLGAALSDFAMWSGARRSAGSEG